MTKTKIQYRVDALFAQSEHLGRSRNPRYPGKILLGTMTNDDADWGVDPFFDTPLEAAEAVQGWLDAHGEHWPGARFNIVSVARKVDRRDPDSHGFNLLRVSLVDVPVGVSYVHSLATIDRDGEFPWVRRSNINITREDNFMVYIALHDRREAV